MRKIVTYNKNTTVRYVGSSLSIRDRLNTYFGALKGKRNIEAAIRDGGLAGFYLEIYLLPAEMIQEDKLSIKNFVLTLEQIYILIYDPEYNMLKVAGSSA